MHIKKMNNRNGNFKGMIKEAREVNNGQKVLILLEIKISDSESIKMQQWYKTEPFYGTPIHWLLRDMGLLEGDCDEIDLKQLENRDVKVNLVWAQNEPYIKSIKPWDDLRDGNEVDGKEPILNRKEEA